MNSKKFLACCGALLALVTVFVNFTLPLFALGTSAMSLYSKMSNTKYLVCASLLSVIAMRGAWLIV